MTNFAFLPIHHKLVVKWRVIRTSLCKFNLMYTVSVSLYLDCTHIRLVVLALTATFGIIMFFVGCAVRFEKPDEKL